MCVRAAPTETYRCYCLIPGFQFEIEESKKFSIPEFYYYSCINGFILLLKFVEIKMLTC